MTSPSSDPSNCLIYRRYTNQVSVGHLALGGENPIRIQSMTNTDTMDTKSTVDQTLRLVDAGCEYVRITAPDLKAATNLGRIKDALLQHNCNVPLIADIHFSPKAAEIAASIVEKVRINPGNYVDRNIGEHFTEQAYNDELKRIADRLYPLIECCKHHQTAIRIGTNHGSLSQRILNRYGDTPEGMVNSAMEFVRICRSFDFHNLVLSMKASNVKVMTYATRLLAQKMFNEEMYYPIHLGVTEAGDAEDGRIKSAAGIGCLLAEGIGDTIRVSLTEDPEKEIPVARKLASYHQNFVVLPKETPLPSPTISYERKPSLKVEKIGNNQLPIITTQTPHPLSDYVLTHNSNITFTPSKLLADTPLPSTDNVYIFLPEKNNVTSLKQRILSLKTKGDLSPILLALDSKKPEDLMLHQSAIAASLLSDGLIDGLFLDKDAEIGLNILQATGDRLTRAEFIACPSCGRTKYDIQSSLQSVKKACRHLTGVKIAVMGCVVNGPGEMSDAHYGYIGAGDGKVNLYKGKTRVAEGVPEKEAVNTLIAIIKSHDDWKECDDTPSEK